MSSVHQANERAPDKIGAAIRARRRQLGLRQADVADLAGVSVRFLQQLERGKASVRLDKLDDVACVLGLRVTVAERNSQRD